MRLGSICAVLLLPAIALAQAATADPEAARPRPPNAAAVYELAWQELVDEFGIDPAQHVSMAAGIPLRALPITEREFHGAVRRSLAARELFMQAAALPRLTIAADGKDWERSPGWGRHIEVAILVCAHALLVAEDEPGAAVEDAIALLRASRQLSSIQHSDRMHWRSIEALARTMHERARLHE